MVRRLVAAAVLMAGLSACVSLPVDPYDPVVVSREESRLDVILDLCDQLLREITVQRVDSSGGGEVTGPVLWAAQLESGAGVNEMTIGEAPPGFRQEIALDGPLPHSEELVIVAMTAKSELSIDVRLSELKNGEVQAGGEIVSREEFDSDRSAC